MRALRSGATSDVIVIGAGIAGVSAAHALQRDCSVRLLEAERHPGTHTTGRSAAFLVESYGNPVVQRLTRAGRGFLESPPAGFCDVPILKPRPSLTIARPDQCQRLLDNTKLALEAGVRLEQVGPGDVERICPSLRPDYCAAAVLEPRAMSIDVAALLAAFLRGFRERGGVLERERRVTGLSWDAGLWQVSCGQNVYRAPVVVNAAGAWGEEIGRLAGARPIGLQPLRRTIVTFDPPQGADIQSWPCLIDADEDFYLKPEGAQLLASPCDETPSEPCDAQPEDLDVAVAVDRVERATTLSVEHVRRRWAGLRSFVADRAPVIGLDAERPGFFWLVGQGGFGIMTSASAAAALAGLVIEGALPASLCEAGLVEMDLSSERATLTRAVAGS